LTAFIARDGAELVTDSRAVALAFKKRHKNVLQTIDRMMESHRSLIAQHARLNFQPCSYAASNGKLEPMYRMTSKGLSELAMSFSGEDAREVRIRFLNAFEEVAERLVRAERSITERLLDLERREMPSIVKGKIGSRLMNERRKEKPKLAEERESLMAVAQPALPLFH
jgi:Rha family phage regulatory protein